MSTHQISLHQLAFTFPNGREILRPTTLAVPPGELTALIGDNGTGKTTLFRLLLGQLRPTQGTLVLPRGQTIAYLPQDVTLQAHDTVADLLQITPVLQSLRAIAAGSLAQHHYDTVGERWDITERAVALLSRYGIGGNQPVSAQFLHRPVAELSGGQVMLIALVGLELQAADVVLLDEPTNNLDAATRGVVHDMLASWGGTTLVISHDRDLLDRAGGVLELYDKQLRYFGGNYAHYEQAIETEQQAARQRVSTAMAKLKQEEKLAQQLQQKQAHDVAYGKKKQLRRVDPKLVANTRKFQAQNTAGKAATAREQSMREALEKLADMKQQLRETSEIRVQLPELFVPPQRQLWTIHAASGQEFELYGPMRVGIVGDNGVGKTLMLRSGMGDAVVPGQRFWATAHSARIGYLPQQINLEAASVSGVSDVAGDSVLAHMQAVTVASMHKIRSQLAYFGLGAEIVESPVWQLSGGQRFRLALAKLLLAEPAHELLVLDEPTNNLDLTSQDALVSGLENYTGALLVVSHDARFLRRCKLDLSVAMTANGELTVLG